MFEEAKEFHTAYVRTRRPQDYVLIDVGTRQVWEVREGMWKRASDEHRLRAMQAITQATDLDEQTQDRPTKEA